MVLFHSDINHKLNGTRQFFSHFQINSTLWFLEFSIIMKVILRHRMMDSVMCATSITLLMLASIF